MNNGLYLRTDTTQIDKMFAKVQLDFEGFTNQFGIDFARELKALLIKRLDNPPEEKLGGTGALRNSIEVVYQATPTGISFIVGMRIYGVFNSFGVGPQMPGGRIYDISNWIYPMMEGGAPQGSGGKQFSFGTKGTKGGRKWGIKARPWIPDDLMMEELTETLVDEYFKMQKY